MSILISIRPEETARTLNGDQRMFIFKTVPKEWADYLSGKTTTKPEPMTGYIYCTKDKPYVARIFGNLYTQGDSTGRGPADICFNGRVVAKFTLKRVEEIKYTGGFGNYFTNGLSESSIRTLSCLCASQLDDYLMRKKGYAYYISDLVIFDKPKELNNFGVLDETTYNIFDGTIKRTYKAIKRAPQSWQYVEELK